MQCAHFFVLFQTTNIIFSVPADFEFTVRAFAVSGLIVSVIASVLIVLCVFVPRFSERTLFHVLTSGTCYLAGKCTYSQILEQTISYMWNTCIFIKTPFHQ